ncbi:hypothetical protein HanPSC8_Chr15g0690971 [Helianthus annuus]|nr:hypothetical protein HanPSC8_Chr15g0690971 [Helianthus annuus]
MAPDTFFFYLQQNMAPSLSLSPVSVSLSVFLWDERGRRRRQRRRHRSRYRTSRSNPSLGNPRVPTVVVTKNQAPAKIETEPLGFRRRRTPAVGFWPSR